MATLPPLGAPSLAYTTKGGGYSEPPRRCEKKSLFLSPPWMHMPLPLLLLASLTPVPNGKGAMGDANMTDMHTVGGMRQFSDISKIRLFY